MKQTVSLLFLLILLTLLVSCVQGPGPVTPADSGNMSFNNLTGDPNRQGEWIFGDAKIVDLMAGQYTKIGTVTVTNDFDYIYFTFETLSQYPMTETKVHVAETIEEFPMTKRGNPKVGHFDYKTDHDPGVYSYQYAVPLGNFEIGGTILFMAHAVIGTETAWAGCLETEGSSWATYCDYTLQWCEIELTNDSNDDPLTGSAYYSYPAVNGLPSYWDVKFQNLYDDEIESTVWYDAWCYQENVTVQQNQWYNVTLSPSTGQVPSPWASADWCRINWILNNKGAVQGITMMELQDAIWSFIPGNSDADGDGLTMRNLAIQNGGGFIPVEGQVVAVILYVANSVQGLFMEVKVDCVEDES